jgi:hypothetical protein
MIAKVKIHNGSGRAAAALAKSTPVGDAEGKNFPLVIYQSFFFRLLVDLSLLTVLAATSFARLP